MHARNRTWPLGQSPEERCRQRILPIEGGDGSTLTLDFTTGVLDPRLTFTRTSGGTYTGNDGLVYGMDFATSSLLAIGTGSKSVILTATAGVDRRYLVGQTVYISNGANNMSGPVTAYNASTQVLTINATATSGSGSFISWTVGNASARFDHDPTTGSPRGLLIEGQSVNLAPNSNLQAAWAGFSNTTLTPNTTDVVSPDGTYNAAKVALTSTGYCSRFESIAGLANATTYTFSYWIRGTAGNQQRVYSTTQSVDLVTQSNLTYTSTGWTRVQITFTSGVANNTVLIYVASRPTGTVNDVLYIWGAQLEVGSAASSHILTGASQGTRNADHCTMPTSSFVTGPLYPQTLFVECIPATPSTAFPDIVRLFDRTAGGTFNYGNEIYYFSAATMSVQRKINSSSGTDRALASGLTYNTRHKFATAIDSSSFIGSYDGLTGSGATTAASALASQVTHLGVGCNGDATPVSVMFGTVRQIKFYPFAMSQSQLNALTTL
jgi:hypothetical protein